MYSDQTTSWLINSTNTKPKKKDLLWESTNSLIWPTKNSDQSIWDTKATQNYKPLKDYNNLKKCWDKPHQAQLTGLKKVMLLQLKTKDNAVHAMHSHQLVHSNPSMPSSEPD